LYAFVCFAPVAAAQDAKAQAKEFYDFGARSFEAGNFRAAAKAFDEAYRLVPKPALLFSAGQAMRRQYVMDRGEKDLRRAIEYYRRYLTEMKEGGRRAEAAAALSELESTAQRLGMTESAPAEPVSESAFIMVSSVKSAEATLDGKKVAMPIDAEVPAGKHVVRLSAPGYYSEELQVSVKPRASFARHVALRPKPARLTVQTDASAEVMLDGVVSGATPMSGPLEVAPGTRRLVLLRTGHRPYIADLALGPDEAERVDAKLEPTSQRYASYVLFGVGAAGIVAGGVLTGFAFQEQAEAQRIDDARQAGNISDADRDAFDTAIARRNDLRLAATVSFGTGALAGVTGLLLFLIDAPEVTDPRPPQRKREPEPSKADKMEMSLSAPGADAGASLSLRF
jgi:hypothetical protein